MTAYDNCVEYMHETLSYSVFPAIERLLLLLEELIGWSMQYVPSFSHPLHTRSSRLLVSKNAYDLNLEEGRVEECIEWARYLAIRVMDMVKHLADEAKNFREFGKWLKYGKSRIVYKRP